MKLDGWVQKKHGLLLNQSCFVNIRAHELPSQIRGPSSPALLTPAVPSQTLAEQGMLVTTIPCCLLETTSSFLLTEILIHILNIYVALLLLHITIIKDGFSHTIIIFLRLQSYAYLPRNKYDWRCWDLLLSKHAQNCTADLSKSPASYA